MLGAGVGCGAGPSTPGGEWRRGRGVGCGPETPRRQGRQGARLASLGLSASRSETLARSARAHFGLSEAATSCPPGVSRRCQPPPRVESVQRCLGGRRLSPNSPQRNLRTAEVGGFRTFPCLAKERQNRSVLSLPASGHSQGQWRVETGPNKNAACLATSGARCENSVNDQAVAASCLRRERIAAPTTPKPAKKMTHVDDSGTGAGAIRLLKLPPF